MKKIGLFVLIAMIVLTACATDQGKSNQEQATKQKLIFWHYFENQTKTAMEDMIQKYNESQDKYEVIPQYIPFTDIKKQLSIGLAARESLPDITRIDGPDHAAFSAMGIFEDVTDRVKKWGEADHFFPGALNSVMYQDKYYGLPLDNNTLVLFYDKAALAEAGYQQPPKTWAELQEYAKKLTVGDRYGLAISSIKSEEGTYQFLPWLLSAGGAYDKMDSSESIRAMSFLTDLIKEGSMSKEVINWKQFDVEKQFATGKAAMMINGPFVFAALKQDAPDMDWGVSLIPKEQQSASVLGGGNLAIVKGKNVDGAWDFATWIMTNMEEYLITAGYFPPRKDIAEKSTYWKNDEKLSVILDQMNTAIPRGPHPQWPQISEAMQTAIQKSLTLFETPAAAMKEAAKSIDKIIK